MFDFFQGEKMEDRLTCEKIKLLLPGYFRLNGLTADEAIIVWNHVQHRFTCREDFREEQRCYVKSIKACPKADDWSDW